VGVRIHESLQATHRPFNPCPAGARPRQIIDGASAVELARLMLQYGIETVGPPPTLD